MRSLAIFTTPADAHIELRHDAGPVFTAQPGTLDGRLVQVLTIDGVPDGFGAQLVVSRQGFVPVVQRGVLMLTRPGPFAEFLVDDVRLVEVPLPSRPFPPERGRLRIEGTRFVREDGSIFQYRGASAFLLFARFWRGEDITPQIAWLVRQGVNVARVFAPGLSWGGEWAFYQPFAQPSVTLHAFLDRLEEAGLRCELCVLTGGGTVYDQLEQVQWACDVASTHPLVLVEVANEPDRNGVALDSVLSALSGRGVLKASGDYPTEDRGDWTAQGVPILHYGTVHSARVSPDRKYARNSKDLFEIQQAFGVPIVGDEPIGFGEREEPGRRITAAHPYLLDTIAHFGIGHLFCAGMTMHSQYGIDSLVPPPESQTQQLCDAVLGVWQRIPPEAQLGAYTRPGHGEPFPIVWSDADSVVTHTYASILNHQAWVVNPAPRDWWQPEAIDGWEIVQSYPDPEPVLVELRRR